MVFPILATKLSLYGITKCDTRTMLIKQENIPSLIFMLRGERVMFDFHLAALYNVETRSLKQTVRRNADRFP